jgi:hypothetical protein
MNNYDEHEPISIDLLALSVLLVILGIVIF